MHTTNKINIVRNGLSLRPTEAFQQTKLGKIIGVKREMKGCTFLIMTKI